MLLLTSSVSQESLQQTISVSNRISIRNISVSLYSGVHHTVHQCLPVLCPPVCPLTVLCPPVSGCVLVHSRSLTGSESRTPHTGLTAPPVLLLLHLTLFFWLLQILQLFQLQLILVDLLLLKPSTVSDKLFQHRRSLTCSTFPSEATSSPQLFWFVTLHWQIGRKGLYCHPCN